MSTPPSRWPEKALGLAFTVLAIALVLNIAAHLIESVLPVLAGIAAIGLIGGACWTIYQFHRSRW